MSENVTVPSLSEALREIEEHIDRGDHSLALERITGLPKQEMDPGEASRLNHFHGVALFHTKRPADALGRFRKSLEQAEAASDVTGQARAVEQLGSVHHHEKRFAEAQTHFERALRLWGKAGDRSGEARSHRNLGNVHTDLNQADKAQAAYAESRRIFKDLGETDEMAPAVIHAASLTYQNKGREAAIEEYRSALEDDGCRHYLVLNNYGFLLLVEDRYEESRKLLEEAREDVDRRDAPSDDVALVHLNLGNVEALTDRFEASIEHLRKATELLTDHPEARATEVLLQANAEHRDKGFHKYLIVDNGQKLALAHLNLATVLAWAGNLEEAEAEARKGIEADRTAPYPYLATGWIHLARGNEKAATEAFRRARGMEPDNEEFRKALDLVNPYLNSKVGRNDPCPCGSGKKFKKCHGGA